MPEVQESILLSIKKLNNVAPDNTGFDDDFVMWINSALADLNQVGVGPVEGLAIEDEETLWDEFIDDARLNQVKTYIGLKVNLYFDPPNNSFGIQMKEKQLEEHLVRLLMAQNDINAAEEVG